MHSPIKKMSGLYLITPDYLFEEKKWPEKVARVLSSGVPFLQYRHKNVSNETQFLEATRLKPICEEYHTRLIINDNLTVAEKVDAGGLHLGQMDLKQYSLESIRNDHPSWILGVTCHDQVSLAILAEKAGADYVSFGRFFASKTKPHAPSAPLSLLGEARKVLNISILAIGGITLENVDLVVKQADLMAVCDAIWNSQTVAQTLQEFLRILGDQA